MNNERIIKFNSKMTRYIFFLLLGQAYKQDISLFTHNNSNCRMQSRWKLHKRERRRIGKLERKRKKEKQKIKL